MKRINTTFVYALLFTITSLNTSCFLFKKNVNQEQNTSNSEAYDKIESSINQHQSEAWNNYLNQDDSSSTSIFFGNSIPFDSVSTDLIHDNWVKVHTNGTIEAKGNIKEVVHKSGKQTTKKDSGNRQSKVDYRNINTNKTIVKTVTITKTKEKKPDVKAIVIIVVVIALLLALVAFVVKKKLWFVKQWAKVINWLKGYFTGI